MPIGQGKDETDDARPTPGRVAPNRSLRDEGASPLGRGADPGAVESHAVPRASEGGSIAAQRGHMSGGQRGGASGLVSRENEDEMQQTRTDEAYHD